MKKLLAAAVIAGGLVAPTTLAAPALADTPSCVSYGEFFSQAKTGDSKKRVTDTFDTKGRELDRWRSGRKGRMLDTIQSYRACGAYSADDLIVNFDDYSFGSRSRGGTLRAFAGYWDHYCLDYEDIYEYEGDYVYDPSTGEYEWDDEAYSWYSYSYCYDRNFEGEFYDDSLERVSARAAGKVDREPVIVKQFGEVKQPA
jgi:hypothetical protein